MARKREMEGDLVMGWPDRKRPTLYVQRDAQGRIVRAKTPVADLQGLITPTDLRYVVAQLEAPEPVHPDDWGLSINGEVERPLQLTLEELREFAGCTVRCVTECSGSDADLFDYLKSNGELFGCNRCGHGTERLSRFDLEQEHTGTVSSGEWTGVPLRAVLEKAGVKPQAISVRAEGFDRGTPREHAILGAWDIPDQEISYDKCLPLEKALHPDTLLAWALNGEYIRHIHGGPVRLVAPGWSGNWSVKWLHKLEVLDHMAPCYYQTQYFYYADSPEDPNKRMITSMGVKSIIVEPRDDDPPLPRGSHVIRGLAWSGCGAITQVEVSVDGGETWQQAHIEGPRDRWLWVRWSWLWHAEKPGRYALVSRATDEAGRVQPQIGWNFLRKNFDGIVPVEVNIE